MSGPIRNPKDFWAGLLFVAIAVFFAATALRESYDVGSARKMGPGYFPLWLSGFLAVLGLALLWRGLATFGAPIGRVAVKGLVLITLATVLFGAVVNWGGLAPAVFLLVLVSAYASVHFRLSYALPLAVGLAVACVLVFIKGLGVVLPVMPHVLGY